jgi:hypothetical protein
MEQEEPAAVQLDSVDKILDIIVKVCFPVVNLKKEKRRTSSCICLNFDRSQFVILRYFRLVNTRKPPLQKTSHILLSYFKR